MYNINVIVNKVACTLVRAKYFSQNFSPPLKKFLRAPLIASGNFDFEHQLLNMETRNLKEGTSC